MLVRLKKLIPNFVFQLLAPVYHFCLSFLSALFNGFPSKKIIVIGITGTAGKTSTAYLIYKTLNQAGYKTGMISTTIFASGDKEELNNKKMTMPGRFFIQKKLRQMRQDGCVYAIIETTSEGIKQFRHRFINYDILLFTNLYPEHIESHGSYEKYRQAKGKLFAHLSRFSNKYINEKREVCSVRAGLKKIDYQRVFKTIIVNGDDKEAPYFLNFWSEAKVIYSLDPNFDASRLTTGLSSEAQVQDLELFTGVLEQADKSGLHLVINGQAVFVPLLGEFNAKNILASYALGSSQKLDPIQMQAGLAKVSNLAGKMELIPEAKNYIAMVDYSFEPEAVKNLYKTIKLFNYKRLIHILGSTGGGRDKARRPILGELAGKNADIVIITNEDPYDEDPGQIIREVAQGALKAGKEEGRNLFLILDRSDAFKKAVELAKTDDFILATGKGAEQFICIDKGRKIAWDDRVELRKAIVDKL